jgi:predicted RNA binding protein YcfA (HicA-like mRNA interferase family)
MGAVKVRDVVFLIEDDGWFLVRQKGSHRQFRYATKAGLVTISGALSDDLHPETFTSIRRQAQLSRRPR